MSTLLQVRCVNQREHQDPHERITHIGGTNPNSTPWKMTESAAITGGTGTSRTAAAPYVGNPSVVAPPPALAEIAFRWRGLEFARARMGAEAVTFRANHRQFLRNNNLP